MSRYVFRKWKKGDRVPSMYVGAADYVILYEGVQVGAVAMGLFDHYNNVFFIEIFEPHQRQGHGTVFIREIEREVRKSGFEVITAYPVLDETVWVKWGYEIEETEKDGNMKLKKDLT